jgi:hypothetical protein
VDAADSEAAALVAEVDASLALVVAVDSTSCCIGF